MSVERVDVLDLTAGVTPAGVDPADGPTGGRPVPRLLGVAVAVTLAAGVLGATALHASRLRTVDSERQLTVTVAAARQEPQTPASDTGTVEADVTLTLRVSVPVRILSAELDGAPPVSRPGGSSSSTRTPSVTVRWRVLCAEVGTIPGPRLLDVDVRTGSGIEHRRVRLATEDTDAVARVFRLSASQACAATRP